MPIPPLSASGRRQNLGLVRVWCLVAWTWALCSLQHTLSCRPCCALPLSMPTCSHSAQYKAEPVSSLSSPIWDSLVTQLAKPGKSGLHARGEGERVLALATTPEPGHSSEEEPCSPQPEKRSGRDAARPASKDTACGKSARSEEACQCLPSRCRMPPPAGTDGPAGLCRRVSRSRAQTRSARPSVRSAPAPYVRAHVPRPSRKLSVARRRTLVVIAGSVYLRELRLPPAGAANSTGSLPSQRHPGKFPEVPGRR